MAQSNSIYCRIFFHKSQRKLFSIDIFYFLCFVQCQYCQLQINHAELLNEQERFRESSLLADSILRATLRINDPVELSKIFVNVATVYARDAQNESKMEQAKFLLKRALNFEIESKLVACIEQNLSAVCNQLKYVQSALGNLNQSEL